MELLLAYLALGGLTALAHGDRRARALARTLLIWPTMLPGMVRSDAARPDHPGLTQWEARIDASLSSLRAALSSRQLTEGPQAGLKLLEDTQHDLIGIARRHAELDVVLTAPENDLDAAYAATLTAPEHRRVVLQQRVAQRLSLLVTSANCVASTLHGRGIIPCGATCM